MRTTPREETARANTQPFLSAGSAMARNVAEASRRWRHHYAGGQVSTEEYEQRKAVLERDEPNTVSAGSAHQYH